MRKRSLVVGGMEIMALVDAVPDPVDPAWSFPAVPKADWAGHAEGSLDGAGRFQPNLGCFVVRMPGRTLLVDFGIGPGPNAYLNGLRGTLPERLAAAGLSFADIDTVAFTHLHMDHVGWAAVRDARGVARASCPAADHYVAEEELSFWSAAIGSAGAHHRQAFDACVAPLVRDGLIRTVHSEGEFAPGVSFLSTPGHTPGHRSVLVRSNAGVVAIAGDVFHAPAQVAKPDWSHRADLEPDGARRSRERFLAQAADGEWLVAAGHFRNGWMFGRVERRGSGYRFMPIETE